MTIEAILDLPAVELEAISDEQYLKWFEEHGYLNVVRPERIVRSSPVAKQTTIDYAMVKKVDELKAIGVDVSHLLRGKKWKKS